MLINSFHRSQPFSWHENEEQRKGGINQDGDG
jgi:hypothetical protein